MLKNQKESDENSKSKGSSMLSPEIRSLLEAGRDLDSSLQKLYSPVPLENLLRPSEKRSRTSKKSPSK